MCFECCAGFFYEPCFGRSVSSKASSSKASGLKRKASAPRTEQIAQNREYVERLRFLAKVPLFRRLPKDQDPLLASACRREEFNADDVVIRQGEEGEKLFVILQGEADVLIEDAESLQDASFSDARDRARTTSSCRTTVSTASRKVATLRVGDYFGEQAALSGELRAATVIARTQLTCFTITRERFQELGLGHKLYFPKREAVAPDPEDANAERAGEPLAQGSAETIKREEELSFIMEALRANDNLQLLAPRDGQLEELAKLMWKVEVEPGTTISFTDWSTDRFYVIQTGTVEAFVKLERADSQVSNTQCTPTPSTWFSSSGCKPEPDLETPPSTAVSSSPLEEQAVEQLGPGAVFGELSSMYSTARFSTVVAISKVALWTIDRRRFRRILMNKDKKKHQEYSSFLNQVDLLAPLSSEEKFRVAEALVEMRFDKGQVVIQEGDPGNHFYILYDGEVSVSAGGSHLRNLASTPMNPKAVFFGERALLKNEPRTATVEVVSDRARTLVLDRESFNLLLGPLQDIIENKRFRTRDSLAIRRFSTIGGSAVSVDVITPEYLRNVGLLGCGGFGRVALVEHEHTGDLFALKCLSKGFVVSKQLHEQVLNEKDILMMTKSPFIVTLHATYSDDQWLYFLMEPALGGELYDVYRRKKLFGIIPCARFYAAGVVLAFEHLHERRIIYRDLKPENLLLDIQGHLKLTDMGLSRFSVGKTYTIVGTSEYFAPELIKGKGHTFSLDWWTLGILVFELCAGRTPFVAPNAPAIYRKVLKGIHQVAFPASASEMVVRFIKGLLKTDPAERLPMRPRGVENIKSHAWYADFSWSALEARTMEAPYKPDVGDPRKAIRTTAKAPKYMEFQDDGSGLFDDFATVPWSSEVPGAPTNSSS